jgi:hypothetical protein
MRENNRYGLTCYEGPSMTDGDIGAPEAFTAEQKSDLVAFLKRL